DQASAQRFMNANVDTGRLECLTTLADRAAGDDRCRHEARTANDARAEWSAELGVEDDATRRDAGRGRVANGEHRIVGEHGADADGNRVDAGAHVVHFASRFWTGEPVAGSAPR